MDEKINNLASFALGLLDEAKDVYDYYIPLADYCIAHPDEEITDDFNDIVGKVGGVRLVFIKISEKLAEKEYAKTKDSKYLKRKEAFAGYYSDNLEKYIQENRIRRVI
ncbi:MAG: hypothetical protein II625_10670 [Bacilli bacterium]|nr:hypothetical protein [Bacilli bacterium]